MTWPPLADDSSTRVTHSSSHPRFQRRRRSVYSLIAQREIAPRTKGFTRWHWGDTSKQDFENSFGYCTGVLRDARRGLFSWVEAKSLRHLLGTYSPLFPPPKSTIAIAFTPDGKTLASTHGDHTVKIIDCQTGVCLNVLDGHSRTPWVVRFHPKEPEILVSGSLDREVRLWNVITSDCIDHLEFYRPIASIAFHAEGEVLAIASGHKLYIWHYDRRGETSSPAIVLKTRRSLRAVSFHPHGGPFLLTAEVTDIDSSDSSMTRARSIGSLHYPPPAVYVANMNSSSMAAEHINSSHAEAGSSASLQFRVDTDAVEQLDNMEMSLIASNSHVGESTRDLSGVQPDRDSMSSRCDQVLHSRDFWCWRLPFIRGRLMGQGQGQSQSQPGIPAIVDGERREHPSVDHDSGVPVLASDLSGFNGMDPTIAPSNLDSAMVSGGSALPYQSSHIDLTSTSNSRQGSAPTSIPHLGNDSIPIVGRIYSELAASLDVTAATELPCTVRLRIWSHDIRSPCDPLEVGCCLSVPYAVLCSEMGAHFSPCGKFLAACVACVLPQTESGPGLSSQFHRDVSGVGTSPTRHPISAHQIMFELRIYSLEKSTFGSVLVSRPIRAAHCLTSIQFSPTSEHILLAYGRRHSSILKSIVIDGESSLPVYTVLEVYRVSDMQLVSVLPSAEDEVNVACFHPFPGGGLVYGTKEGKLRFLKFDRSCSKKSAETNLFIEDSMVEVE